MYEHIMIVLDDSEVASAAQREGLALAAAHHSRVTFAHVLPNYVMPITDGPPLVYLSPEQHRQDVEQIAQRVLGQAKEAALKANVPASSLVLSHDDAAAALAQAAVDQHCDLLVVGSHGRTPMQRLLFGSLVTRLVTVAPVPLLVCKLSDHESHDENVPPGMHAARSAPRPPDTDAAGSAVRR